MRRSICYCEPNYASAGESRTWKFIYTPSATLPKGTRLKFDLQSKGREIDWQIPSVNLKKAGPVRFLGQGEFFSGRGVAGDPGMFESFFDLFFFREL